MHNTHTVFIVGCGDVGCRLGQAFAQHYSSSPTPPPRLYGLTRNLEQATQLKAADIHLVVLDLDQLSPTQLDATWLHNAVLYYFVPPPPHGDSDTRIERFLHALPALPHTLIQISTTGVYGNTHGAWVNENSPVHPDTPRAQRRLSAERIAETWCTAHGIRHVILRAPAIYGPNRLPLARLQAGEPVIQASQSPFVNRIHIDDLVTICLIAAMKTELRGIYNVSDGNTMTMTEYLQLVARLAHLPMPKEISIEEAKQRLSSEFMSYMNESRRIDNSKLLKEFGVKLKYSIIDDGVKNSLTT